MHPFLMHPFLFLYRFSPGGVVSWLEKDSDHTVRKRKERRAKKERKEKRRSKITDGDLFLLLIIKVLFDLLFRPRFERGYQEMTLMNFSSFFLSLK